MDTTHVFYTDPETGDKFDRLPPNPFGIDVSNSTRWFNNNLDGLMMINFDGTATHFDHYLVMYKTTDTVGLTEKNLTVEDLTKTHKTFAVVKAEDLEHVFQMMQGDICSPQGELRDYVTTQGHNHTSISCGDIIVSLRSGTPYQVEFVGFKNIVTGEVI
jgi:hypothetical protein